MPLSYQQILTQLQKIDPSSLKFVRGIEKEGLRVNADSQISQIPHPTKLGSALTHSHITTDYSEALLEFITPALDDPPIGIVDIRRIARIYIFQYWE